MKAFDWLNVTTEELAEKNDELRESYEESATELQEVESRLKEVKDRILELQQVGTLSVTEEDELEQLRLENKELEYRKTLLDEIANKKQAELNAGIRDEYNSKTNEKYHLTFDPESGKYYDETTGVIYGDDATITLEEKYNKEIQCAEELIGLGEDLNIQQQEQLGNLQASTSEYASQINTILDGYKSIEDNDPFKEITDSIISNAAYVADPAKYKSDHFAKTWESDSIGYARAVLNNLSKQGKLTVEEFNGITENLSFNLASKITEEEKEVAKHFNSLSNKLKNEGYNLGKIISDSLDEEVKQRTEGLSALMFGSSKDKSTESNLFGFNQTKNYNVENLLPGWTKEDDVFKSEIEEYAYLYNELTDMAEKYGVTVDQLSEAGIISSTDLKLLKQCNYLIEDTRFSVEEIVKQINSLNTNSNSDKPSFLDSFKSLSTGSIESILGKIDAGELTASGLSKYEELRKILSETGIAADVAYTELKEYAESYEFTSELTNSIRESYSALKDVKDEFSKTGEVSTTSLNAAIEKFPELKYLLTQYEQGWISSKELIQSLENAYSSDADAYRASMIDKMQSDAGFYNAVYTNNIELITSLSEAYQNDSENWTSLAQAKADIDEALIQQLSSSWGEYFGYIIDANTGLMKITAAQAPEDESAEYLESYAALKEIIDARNKLTEAAKLEIKLPKDFNSKDTDGDGSGGDSNKPEEIDWIERKKEILQRLHDVQEKIAGDETESYEERKKALEDLIDIDRQRAKFSGEAAAQYEKAWLDASKNLSEEDKTFIKEGGDVVKKYDAQELLKEGKAKTLEEGKQYIEDLKESKALYDKMVESQQEEKDNQKKLIEDQKRKIQLIRDQIAAQQDLNDAITDQINLQKELDEANGEYIGRAHYEDLISQSKEKELLIQKDINELQNKLNLAEESAERDNILAEIESCRNELIQCQVEQAELNDTILRLPIERLQMFRDLYAQIIEDMDNYRSIQEKMGLNPTKEELQTYIDLYAESIDSSLEQQSKLKDLLKNYSYGSDKFNETSEEIQNLDNEISNLIASQIELNNQMLQIPITEMSEQIDKLGNVKTLLQNSISEDNAKGLQTTVSQYAELHSLTLQQLNLYAQQKEELAKLLDVYDEESEYYKETEKQILDIENEMSNLVQETYEWNQELLDIPIANLEKVNENLSNYSSILGEILSDYDSALSGVNTLIDNEIEGVQDVLDALNQQNEALQIQRKLEQSLYNLRRAEEQKNVAVIRNGEKVYESNQDNLRSAHQEFADAQYDKMVYDLEQQIEALENIKDKWQEIIDKIEEAKNLQAAEDLFGSGWQDSVLADSVDLRDLFKSLYESAYNEKEAVDKQVVSNERMIQMMNELIARYRDGSITYEEALSGINSMTDSADGNYTAIEMLNGMMSLDGISGLKDISEATQVSVDETVGLLKQYMQIAESNKESVEHFETSLEGMSQRVTESVESFKKSAESLQIYIDTYKANSEAINEYTKTWDEMKKLIEEQVQALKAAAEALEKQEKTSTSSSKPSSSGSSSSNKSDSGSGVYYSAGGNSYHESTGTPAEIIGSYGTDKEKESYRDYREGLIEAKREKEGEGWYEAAMKQLDEELKKAGVYHKGILKGPVGFDSSSNDSIYQFAKRIAVNPLKADEVAAILQKGEFVIQPGQMSNIMKNNQMIGQMAAEEASNAISRYSTNTEAYSFSIGEVHLHEVQNVDELAKALSQTFETSMQQNFSKIFKH